MGDLPENPLGMEKRRIHMEEITASDYHTQGRVECHPYYARLNNINCWASKYPVSISGFSLEIYLYT